jgi:hypothetical protein
VKYHRAGRECKPKRPIAEEGVAEEGIGWSGMTISSNGEQIVKDLPGNTKKTQIKKGGAESRF